MEEGREQGRKNRDVAAEKGREKQEHSGQFEAQGDEQDLNEFLLKGNPEVLLEEGIVQGCLGRKGEAPPKHEIYQGGKGHDA